jgi:succinate dehydrogenase / fumarate reductase membrane anchor subunit
MVKRLVVGAHYGLKDWLAQRVTAAVMAIYALLVGFAVLVHGPFDYEAWRAFATQGWMRITTFMFVIALGYHAWIGVRDIVMDYVKPAGGRLVLHAVVAVLLIGYIGWAVQVLWRI